MNETSRPNLFDIFGKIETLLAIPTGIPSDIYGQVKLVTDSFSAPTTMKLCIYSAEANKWNYIALTIV